MARLELTRLFRLKMPLMYTIRGFVKKLVTLNVRMIDIAALMCVAIWTDGKRTDDLRRATV